MKTTTKTQKARERDRKIYDKLDPPGHPSAVLIREARSLERLQTKRRRIVKLLKALDAEIRTTKRALRTAAQQVTADQTPPLRKIFGETRLDDE